MSNNKIKIFMLSAMGLIMSMAACTKTTTVLENNSPEVTKTVSFSKDIIPVLTVNCAKSGCHAGTISPNLSSTNAYNSLVNGNQVNLQTPASSNVYLWLTGKDLPARTYMPLGSANNPGNINGLILAWIKQGAKNN